VAVKYRYKSNISRYIIGYLGSMRAAGYKYRVPERMLRQFDQYCFDHNIEESVLPREAVEEFCHGDGYGSQATRELRIRVVRNLTEYMEKAGCSVYIQPLPLKAFRYPRHDPYIYSEKEISAIFFQIDSWKSHQKSHSNRKEVDPLLFRMLYGCGLRITEALNLKVGDVDLREGVLKIRQAKNNKERFVPMAESLTERCRNYCRTMHRLNMEDSYFFPGQHGGCYDQSTIYRRFRQYLWKAGISHCGKGPNVHSFRHAYCIHRLKNGCLKEGNLPTLCLI